MCFRFETYARQIIVFIFSVQIGVPDRTTGTMFTPIPLLVNYHDPERVAGQCFHILLWIVNPLKTTVIQKLLEIIGIVRLCPSCSFATALDSDINQTTGTGGLLSMWENRCMHAAVCLLRAGQPRSAGDAAKLGQFIGQFSWVTGDPIVLKGLNNYGLFWSSLKLL